MHTIVRVKRKIAADVENIQSAILLLEARLGETQEGMARILGCTLGAYSKWHRGETIPGGQWLIKMIQLCPDDETRAAFGLKPERNRLYVPKDLKSSNLPILPPGGKIVRKLSQDEKDEILRQYSDAHRGIELLWEVATLGHEGAAAALRDLADKLTTRGGDWRRMKYLKK
jgi:hypothetical protein